MNPAQVKNAADALGRLEALEEALGQLDDLPHEALSISFYGKNSEQIHAYYPREQYRAVLNRLIGEELRALSDLGVTDL